MVLTRQSAASDVMDVLDRVLDKGIVIDARVDLYLVGIDLITLDVRVVVASIQTYLKYADALALGGSVPRPALEQSQKTAALGRRLTSRVHQATRSSRVRVA